MEDGNNDPWKHHSEDGNFIKDFDGWSNKSDPDVGRQQRRDSNTSKENCELGKTVKQDGLDAWELCSREINVKGGDTGGWGTWGTEDGQSAAAAWKHGIRDANVTKKENIREATVQMTTPDPWKQHPRHGNGKKGQDGAAAWNHDIRDDNVRRLKNGREEAVNLTTPDLWKQHTRHGNDKKGIDAWDDGLDKKSNPELWKHHSRDGSKRESDGRGKASYNSVKKEIDRWATRGSADSQGGADAWNHDISDHNAKRAKNGCGKPFAHITSDPLKQSERDSIVKHVTDSWDKQLDKKSNPEVRKHHSRNGSVDRMNDDTRRTLVRLSRSPDRRSSAHDRSGKDSWKHDYRDRSDTYRRTTVSKSPNRRGSAHDKSGKDLWKHDNRDWCDNYRRMTVSKSPDRRGSAHDKNGKDSWKHDNRDMSDSSRRTAARSSKSPDRRVSDARKQHYKEGNVKTETAGSDRRVSTRDKSGKNTGRHHDRDEIDNYRKKTARLGKSPDMPVSDARKQHYEEGNVKTETAGSEYVTKGTDGSSKAIGVSELYSSKQHGEGNANRETDGWGKATGWSDPDASRQHSVEGYTKKESGGWGNVKREADGGGKSSDMSHLDSSKPHGGNCNVERKTDGLGVSPDRCDPVVSRQHNGEGNVAEETDGWSKAPDTDALNSLKQYDEGWAKAAGEDGPDTWKQRSKEANIGKDTRGWGLCLDSLKQYDEGWAKAAGEDGPDTREQRSKEANIGKDPLGWGNAKCETDGWGKAPDTSVFDSSKKHGGEGNDKRVTDGWSNAVSEDVPNIWEQCSKELNTKKETLGWGTWDAFQGKIGPNTWNHHARDHNVKSDDGWGKPADQMDRNHWNDAKKETDGWSKSPNQLCPGKPDRLSCSISLDSGPNRDRGRCPPVGSKRGGDKQPAKAAGEDGPDTREQCSKEANIGKDPLGWGNVKCETDGWGKAPDTSVFDSSKKHGAEGNDKRVTDGWSNAVSEDVPNVWEQCSKEVNTKKETLGWGTWDAFQGKIGPNTWNHHARDHNVKSDDGWGKPPDQMDRNHWNDAKKETDGWSKSPNQLCPGKPDRLSCSISPDSGLNRDRGRCPPVGSKRGRDNSCRTGSGGYSVVCRLFASGQCRWGSQCRFLHEDPGSGSFGAAISEGWGSAAVCRQFVAGQCKWGSQCRFLHEDRGTGSFDTDITESRGSAAVCRQFAVGLCRWGSQCKYLHEDHDAGRVQNDGHQGQTNGEDMSELYGTKRASSYFDFLKGRCQRGPACKFAHHDASYVGRCTKDEAVDVNLDKTCDGPGLAGQATSDNASNSSRLLSRDCSVVAAATGTVQPMEGIDFIHEPLVYRAESCASTFQRSSQIGTDRMMLDGDSLHMMPSKMDPCNKNEEQKQVELGKMDGAGNGHSKKEQGPCPTNVSVSTDDTTSIIKDDHAKKFKFALTEYVKVILKPIWKEGRVSKEVHNLIVKKAVAKVISIVPGPNIPRTPVQIEQYLSFSETKLKKLVQGYLDLYLKPEPVPGKT